MIIPDAIDGLPVTAIGGYYNRWNDWVGAFSGCSGLTTITIPNSVTDVQAYAFCNCDHLIDVTVPNSVIRIGDAAFYDCTGLASVMIPDGVSNIGTNAFNSCMSLTNVMLGNGVTNIGGGAFGFCLTLSAIVVDALNPAYCSVDGVLFDKSKSTLIQCPGGKGGSYTLPDSVANIGDYGFLNCINLTSLTIPNSVTSIRDGAFSGCLSLTSVHFQGNAPDFGTDVFDYWVRYHQVWDPATIYYLPGTTGWEMTHTGLPVEPWNPQVQASDASFGVRTNQFGFNINWASGMTVVVEAAKDLTSPIWTPVATNTLTSGSFYFSDPNWTKYPKRFYRVRSS